MSSVNQRAGSRTKRAVDAWEALFRAQALISRELNQANTWLEVSASEYGVLFELTRWPSGARLCDLQADELLSQPGLSRLVARLERRGLIARANDPEDRRAVRLQLTTAGREVQRRVGLLHAREIVALVRLPDDQLEQLRQLCVQLAEQVGVDQANDQRTTS
jgi:DNA-binding MarR family transcriptional regulator